MCTVMCTVMSVKEHRFIMLYVDICSIYNDLPILDIDICTFYYFCDLSYEKTYFYLVQL